MYRGLGGRADLEIAVGVGGHIGMILGLINKCEEI